MSRNGLLVAGGRTERLHLFSRKIAKHSKQKHTQHGGDCDATIAKDAAAVTHVQSQSQEVGSGDEGLGLLCFNLSSAETDFWWLEDKQRDFAYSLGKWENTRNKNTHSMYGGDCDAAIAKAAAAVTHVQSQSQEVGSGDEGLGLLCCDLSSAETDFGGWRTSSRDFAYFRVSCYILRSS